MGQYLSTESSWPEQLTEDHVRQLRHHMRVVTTLSGVRIHDERGAYIEYTKTTTKTSENNGQKREHTYVRS